MTTANKNIEIYQAYGQDWMNVHFKDYMFNGEVFMVRQDFWDAFDACPNAEAISDGGSIGVGMDDFTLNHSNCIVVSSDADMIGEAMLVSRPNMLLN